MPIGWADQPNPNHPNTEQAGQSAGPAPGSGRPLIRALDLGRWYLWAGGFQVGTGPCNKAPAHQTEQAEGKIQRFFFGLTTIRFPCIEKLRNLVAFVWFSGSDKTNLGCQV